MSHSAGGFSRGFAFAVGNTAHTGVSLPFFWDVRSAKEARACSSLNSPHYYHGRWNCIFISTSSESGLCYYYIYLGNMAGFLSCFLWRKCQILYLHFHINLPSALCTFASIKNVITGNWEGLLEIKIVEASAPFHSTVLGGDEGGQALRVVLPSQRGAAGSPSLYCRALGEALLSHLCHVSALSLLCHLAGLALTFRGVLLRYRHRANVPGILPQPCLPAVQRLSHPHHSPTEPHALLFSLSSGIAFCLLLSLD